MNFGIAKIFNAVDKTIQDKFNYLIDLLSKFSADLDVSLTPNEILAKVVTVDGTGSGLDADLLDGKHYSDIFASPTFSGLVTTAGQIKFPATQNASTDVNTLDDYEESTSYTPTVTATDGTFTTVSATSRYVKVGKIVFIRYHVVITNKGTASGGVVITLPFNAAAEYYTGNGVEIAATVSNLFCYTIGSNAARIYRYDGASMITNGYQLVGTLVYEATA